MRMDTMAATGEPHQSPHPAPMATDPLTPAEVDAVLRPSLRTLAADLLALSDNLDRMREALASLSSVLADAEATVHRHDREQPRSTPPRAD